MYEKGVVLPMFYLPPVAYFAELNKHKTDILIDKEEHFIKQTYRNRAHIYSPDGILALTVPVVKGAKVHTKAKDVKISYDFNWQRMHWMGLQNCYRRSAYFEFYEDSFAPFYHMRYDNLFDYNLEQLKLIIKLLKIKAEFKFTEDYELNYPERIDLRLSLDPKKNTQIDQKPYFQLFEERHGFLNNLSMGELLLNRGRQAINYL